MERVLVNLAPYITTFEPMQTLRKEYNELGCVLVYKIYKKYCQLEDTLRVDKI